MRIALTGHFIPKDITGLAVNVAIWTCIEVSLGVICACIPCLTPVVLRMIRSKRKQFPRGDGKSDTINLFNTKRNSFGRDNGFHRMHELSELGATFEMTIYSGNYANCQAAELSDRERPKHGISVTKEVEQSVISRPVEMME